MLHGDCLTVTGKTVAENLKDVPSLTEVAKLQEELFVVQRIGNSEGNDGDDVNSAAAATTATGSKGAPVLFGVGSPLAPPGHHLTVVKGSLAPESAVAKLSGKMLKRFQGTAKVV